MYRHTVYAPLPSWGMVSGFIRFNVTFNHELGGPFTHVANPPFAAPHAQIITVTRGHHGHCAGHTEVTDDISRCKPLLYSA